MAPRTFRALIENTNGKQYWEYYSTLDQPPWADSECFQIIVKDEQFTGLLDSRGMEIFEGDIIKYEHGFTGMMRYEVKYEPPMFYPVGFDNGNYHDSEIMHDWETSEVIGNIHENPELLEGGKAID